MLIIRAVEGELYTPGGHDATVVSRKLFNPANGCRKLEKSINYETPGRVMVFSWRSRLSPELHGTTITDCTCNLQY